MEALALGVETTLVQGTTHKVSVVLAAQVAGQLPGDGAGGVARQSIVHNTTWVFHQLLAYDPVLVQAHVVNDHGNDVGLAGLQGWQGVCSIVIGVDADAGPRAYIGFVDPHGAAKR